MRTCIACRTRGAQATLLRFARRRDGVVVPAIGRRDASGRSAYVCPRASCLSTASRRRAFERSLGRASQHPGERSGSTRIVRVPPDASLVSAVLASLDREIEILARTGPACGSPRAARLESLRDALRQPGRND